MRAETSVLKAQVYADLGGSCVECGEDDPDKLTIDHIANDGALERKTQPRGGARYYARLLKTGGTTGRQLLCWNCNQKKARQTQQPSGARVMPPAAHKKQIRLTILEDSDAYLDAIARERGCSPAEAFDQIAREHQQLHLCLRSIEEGIDYLVSLHPLPTPHAPEKRDVISTVSEHEASFMGLPEAPMTWWRKQAQRLGWRQGNHAHAD